MGNQASQDQKYVITTGMVALESLSLVRIPRSSGKAKEFPVNTKKVSMGSFLDMSTGENLMHQRVDELNQYKLRVRLKEQGSGIKELTLKTFNATDLNVTDIPVPVQGLLPALRLKHMYEDGVLYDHHDLPFTPDATGKVFNASTPTFDNRLFAESVQKLRPGAQPVVFSYLIDENQRVHMLLYGRTILVSADDNQVTPLVSLHTMPGADAHAPLKASLSAMSNAEKSSIRANAIVNLSSAKGETSKATSADSAMHSAHKPPPSRPHNVLFGLVFVETFLVLLLFSLYWDAWSTINAQQARLAAYGAGGEAVCKYLYSDTSGG